THGVPAFDAGRRVAKRPPPPHVQLARRMRAVMEALDFSQFQGVEDHADVAMLREPGGMVLVVDLAAIGDAVKDGVGVAADVQYRWDRKLDLLGHVEVGRYIEAGARLKVELLDGERVGIELAG